MSFIPNFPPDLLEEHKRWHHARHNVDINNPPIGYGQEFLRFHRDYISRALAWYNQSGNDPRLVEPWASVPEAIRRAPCYNQAAEARVISQPESFATSDELGRFIESSNLHACIHQTSAQLYADPDINDFDVAPHDTVFYNIHGLIDRWYRNWEGLGRFSEGRSYWCGTFEVEDDEVLTYSPIDRKWQLGRQNGIQNWRVVGDSGTYGAMDDGRLFRIWDSDADGKLEVLFLQPDTGIWYEGKIKDGQLRWQPIRLQPLMEDKFNLP
ncbi:hypothetical protein D7Z26_20040 [Cohnella endophytica]|uniref:Tyrosinase copper-binding domain-containing protein n=1 Tax=Cohnella endophytica TaxID=2419778 RepID=A0A494XK40_9BACL|nr:tyrosinase family protein [Cohnella endophytica]RKP50102.1 hypothetical protein D7Z26_20040 [Cohnella endophytica]